MAINIPKGTKDVLPQDSYKWQYIEAQAREVARLYNISEIRTPTFEHTELFLRGVGDTTDVVNKEMYTFIDKGNRSITLKPEGTAGVARAYIESNLGAGVLPVKMFYFTPVFRYEKPQAGRLREHHQFGVEVYGSPDPAMDVEVISVARYFLNTVGVKDLELHINSIGCPICRARYNQALKDYFFTHLDEMCETCRERFEKNPLRILDCKNVDCKALGAHAPVILDYLCDDCKNHMEAVEAGLKEESIAFSVDPHIVRGLDYYTRTVFEFVTNTIGAQGTVCGGGRYDNLVTSLGGKATPAVGFGLGLERLLLVLEACSVRVPDHSAIEVYIANVEAHNASYARQLTKKLRNSGISADCDRMSRSLKAQFKFADKIGAKYVIAVGDTEEESGNLVVKNMKTSSQTVVQQTQLAPMILGVRMQHNDK